MADYLNPRAFERLVRAARAAHVLSETLWEALHEQLTSPEDGERVAALSRRLADVAATVALLAYEEGTPAPAASGATPPVAPAVPIPSAEPAVPTSSAEPAVPMPSAEPEMASRTAGAERTREETSPLGPVPASAAPRAQTPPVAATLIDELAPVEGTDDEIREIEIRDERGVRPPSAWIAGIERRLERHRRDREPFAVMAIELVDIERLRHAELPGEVARLTGLVETALAGELRPADSLMRESPGRYWLLAPETDSDGARTLAGRLDAAVAGAASQRGAPLQVAVGIATCPADGLAAGALAAHADVALYAARAAGRPLAP